MNRLPNVPTHKIIRIETLLPNTPINNITAKSLFNDNIKKLNNYIILLTEYSYKIFNNNYDSINIINKKIYYDNTTKLLNNLKIYSIILEDYKSQITKLNYTKYLEYIYLKNNDGLFNYLNLISTLYTHFQTINNKNIRFKNIIFDINNYINNSIKISNNYYFTRYNPV
jgi:hypothetical protein